MPGLGLSIPEVAARRTIDPAARALIARMGTPPDGARTAEIDRLVRALRGAGVWPRLIALYLLAAHDAQAARLNWVEASYDLAAFNAPAFTVDRGYAGDGATSYLDTGFAPTGWASPDSACFGIWSLTADGSTGPGIGAFDGDRQVALWNRYGGGFDLLFVRLNSDEANQVSVASTDGTGLFMGNRSSASDVQAYRNGASVASSSSSSSNAPGVNNVLIGVPPNAGRFAAAVIADSLTAGEHAALHEALAAYLAATGAA
ncbi:MAG: hypothetical protein WDN24_06905 [Sphingomonas sp.]